MFRSHRGWLAALILVISAVSASAQSRDSVLNGALIGAGAGVGSAFALDAVFCDNGFGGCDTPWKAIGVLGGIGAGAGAGIDLLIGRKQNPSWLRVSPILGKTRRGVSASLKLPGPGALPGPALSRQGGESGKRDSVWNGLLIGAGVGIGSGYVWGYKVCGGNDDECFAIAGPAGMITGAGIGAAVGAIADLLHD